MSLDDTEVSLNRAVLLGKVVESTWWSSFFAPTFHLHSFFYVYHVFLYQKRSVCAWMWREHRLSALKWKSWLCYLWLTGTVINCYQSFFKIFSYILVVLWNCTTHLSVWGIVSQYAVHKIETYWGKGRVRQNKTWTQKEVNSRDGRLQSRVSGLQTDSTSLTKDWTGLGTGFGKTTISS